MLLEEIVLLLLKTAGYDTIEKAGSDPPLHDGHSGQEESGRGVAIRSEIIRGK